MTISIINTVSSTGGGGTPSITHGLSIQEGDLLLCTLALNGGTNTPSDIGTFTASEAPFVASSSTGSFLYKTATASEPASYSFSVTGNDRWAIQLCVLRSSEDLSFDVMPTLSTEPPATTTPIPAITTTVADTKLIAFAMTDNSNVEYSNLTNGFTIEDQVKGGQSSFIASKDQPAAGNTGSLSFDSTLAVANVLGLAAIKEQASTGPKH